MKKPMRCVSKFVERCCNSSIVKDKNDLINKITQTTKTMLYGSKTIDSKACINLLKALPESQIKSIIGNINYKEKELIKEKKVCNKFIDELNNKFADKDIDIIDVRYGNDNYCVMAEFSIGKIFLEGTRHQIIQMTKEILEEAENNQIMLCPVCNSDKLLFLNWYGLCYDCGTLSDIDNKEIIEKYTGDKSLWRSSADNTIKKSVLPYDYTFDLI